MIIHDNSESAKYFVKGLEYVKSLPAKKKLFSKTGKLELSHNEEMDYLTIVGTSRKESLEFISEKINLNHNSGLSMNQIIVVITDYFKDSMIRPKYIKAKVLRGNKAREEAIFVYVEFDEMNQIIQIEDEYNQCFSYKNLSRNYKKQLQLVSSYNKLHSHHIEVSKSTPKKGGKDFANSSLV